MGKIVVIGSSNTDMVIKSKKIPAPGETVIGGNFIMADGGKGANQAVAVAKLGGDITFITKLGNDMFGNQALEKYTKYGMNTKYIRRDESPSGVALIMVDGNGENCISVASGANAKLSPEDIDTCREEIENAEILLMQMEIPIETICYATDIAYNKGVKVVLNPAPASKLPVELFSKLYMITPNRTEAQMLSDLEVNDISTAKKAARIIADKGVRIVLTTLGDQGALILENGKYTHIEARKVEATDTTAAGDVFNGGLCVGLSEGLSVEEAVRFATIASSISVTRMGAQSSIPERSECTTILKSDILT